MQDARLTTFDSYPLAATPLSLFLARNIRLDRGVQVTKVTRMADGFSITARDGLAEPQPTAMSAMTTDSQTRSQTRELSATGSKKARCPGVTFQPCATASPYSR